MKTLLRYHTLVMVCLLPVALFGQQVEKSFRSRFGPDALVGYLAYVPDDYHTSPSKKYPLLIFLHGVGEKTYQPTDLSDLHRVKTHGPPKLIAKGEDFPFIVISPQCPFSSWDLVTTDGFKSEVSKPGEFVDEILEKVKSLYRVDTDRIYITGLSMGGAATWSYIMEHPEKIAAAIPISCATDEDKICTVASNRIGVWAFQNEDDQKASNKSAVANLNYCNDTYKAKLTMYPGKEHDAWTVTYNNDEIYDWLLKHSKSKGSTITNIEENNHGNGRKEIKVYPQPAANDLNIEYFISEGNTLQLSIVNEISEIVLKKSIALNTGDNKITLDVSGLPNGIYFINFQNSEKNARKKVVISR